MKKLFVLIAALMLSASVVAFAADSPTLLVPPVVSNVSVPGVSVAMDYKEQTEQLAQSLADAVKEGKTELEYFDLSENEMAKLVEAGFDPATISVDEFLYIAISGYEEKPEGISFTATFSVPHEAGEKVLLLMGVGTMPGPFDWSVQEAVVNEDGSITVTLKDFPVEPFILCLLS